MKKFLVVVVIGLIFCACSVVGYMLANRADQGPFFSSAPTTALAEVRRDDQYRLMVLYVDQLDNPQPVLLSTWYVSLFFLEDGTPTLTFAQVYPSQKKPELSAAMQHAFSLDAQRDPGNKFWQSMQPLQLTWESFIVIDRNSAQKFFEWANGPGDYAALLDAPNEHPREIQQSIKNSCQQVAEANHTGKAAFVWGDIIPTHFHSNLQMEVAIAYWDRMAKAIQPEHCEVLLSR